MRDLSFRALLVFLVIGIGPQGAWAQAVPGQNPPATPMKEFVTACTYGVLAGALVGTATLAFEDKPGDNLQNVARGASIGLYLGILLGLYVVYIVPDQLEKEKLDMYEEQGLPPPEGALPRLNVYPLISQNKVDGAAATWRVLSF
ncbi:MAG: hypothetical protein IT288_16200 [Bdellovibrionales bacterium]|nr:hypothetical protein [Bdellovibrionales bacterium]